MTTPLHVLGLVQSTALNVIKHAPRVKQAAETTTSWVAKTPIASHEAVVKKIKQEEARA